MEGSPAVNEFPKDFANREPTDSKQFNFDVNNKDDEDENFLINRKGPPYTNARRDEILLLKVLTEI